MSGTNVIALDVRDGELLGQIFRHGALPTACRAGDDPHMTVMELVLLQGSVHLRAPVHVGIIAGQRRHGGAESSIQCEHDGSGQGDEGRKSMEGSSAF